MNAAAGKKLRRIFDRMFEAYGRQFWWPGDSPFEIMVGAILTQNTAWTNVERAIANIKAAEGLDPAHMLDLRHEQLARQIRPAGYFNVKAKRLRNFCRWYLDEGGFDVLKRRPTERLRRDLLSVNGVGHETADDIVLYAFDRPVFVIDAYTRRIFARVGLAAGDEAYETLRHNIEHRLGKDSRLFNEYHALLVRHGKDICRPRPLCSQCCIKRSCTAYRAGVA